MPADTVQPNLFQSNPPVGLQRMLMAPSRTDSVFQSFHQVRTVPFPPPAKKPKHPVTLLPNGLNVPELLGAAGLFTAGMLTHQLPARAVPGVKRLLPTDPKVWARVILGILAVNKLNKALDWQPPPWLGGVEAVAVITPLAMKFNKASLKQAALLAPLVGAVVQAASWLNSKASEPLHEKFSIPPFVTRMTIALGMALAGLKASKLLGIGGAMAMTCARGCTPGSIVCLSELGEMVSGMKTWLQNKNTEQPG
jgi:hypothetical protein